MKPLSPAPFDTRQLRIASPCPMSWEDMTGDERRRFCAQCKKDVYDVASLTRAEVALLVNVLERDLCVQLYRRRDGTVITADCAAGRVMRTGRWLRRGLLAVGAATGLLTLVTAGLSLYDAHLYHHVMSSMGVERSEDDALGGSTTVANPGTPTAAHKGTANFFQQ